MGGGADLVGVGTNSRGGYVLKNLYVKMKESGPVGGRTPAAPPGSATDKFDKNKISGWIQKGFPYSNDLASSSSKCRSTVLF